MNPTKSNPKASLFTCALLLLSLAFKAAASRDHHDHDEHENNQHSQISEQMSQANGIKTLKASGGVIEQKIKVYGRLQAAPEHKAEVRARFPGVVVSMTASIGDTVTKGQVLATIESNVSLQTYNVVSPINGMIQHRMVNPGEFTGNKTLFNILNSESLSAELKVFHQQRKHIKSGQNVTLWDDKATISGQVHHIIPGPVDQPFLLARVPFNNKNGQHTPGDLISADITINQENVEVLVVNEAIQMLDGGPVVFVQTGDRFQAQPVTLGIQDDHHTAITSGLQVGQTYVANNSYLIKADIEKSSAGHSH